jgi:LPXTG-motif cell wall-anchored protein
MEKLHYKMYKDGKKWVFAATTVVALGGGLGESTYAVRADSMTSSVSTGSSADISSTSENMTVPATSTDNSANTSSTSENTTVPATSTDNSVNTSSTSENTTVPATSTDNSANTSSTSENTTVPATSTDNSVNTSSTSENTTVPATSTDNSANTSSTSENTTVPATSTDNSANTSSTSENTTVPATSTDNSVNTSSTSENTTVPATSTDNSKKIKSSLVSNHLEEKDNLENVALSSNSVQPATSISDDTYLKNLGIDINDLNTNSVLKLASLFHIFANQASLSADTNGNLAVKILNGSNNFGTLGDSYNLTSGDIYYIQQLAKDLQSNAFRNKTFNHVVLGKDVNVSIENNKVLINGITMDNLKPEDVYQDTTEQTYIDFSDVFQQLISASTSYTSTTQTKDVISNYSDMNNRYIDVSGVAAGTQIIYVNVPFKYLSASQPITIKGISHLENGPTIVINVTDIPNGDQNISTQVQLYYDDGTNALPNSKEHTEPNHVLWNLGTGGQTFNFSSGRFMGSILAPNATINAGVNIDGNIVANIVNITGGESHRWDIHPQPTQPTITTESKTINETIHYVYKDGTTAHDDYVAKPVEFTREVSTDAVTGEKTYGSWSADQSFAAVTSPAIKGYTADKAQIDKQTVNGDSKDLEFKVTYTKNAPTITTESKTINETIHYVYKDGTTAHDDYVAKPVEFTREVSTDAVTGEKTYGSWSADQSFAAVTSPAIKGYTADKAQIDKQTVNGDSKDLEFKVTYTKNAPTITTESKTINETIHYVYKDGTTAHDDYVAKPVEFTREVSTDAVTGEKTYGSWSADQSFAAVTSPAIKGYTADKAQIDKQTVNGDSKDLEFKVTYTKNAPTITTESKTINETIHYVYKDGTTAHDDYVAKPVEFTREVSTDAVTGEKTYGSWSADQSFAAVTSPAIKGYTPDQAEIGSQTVSGDSSGSWSADQSFAAVTSPAIKGYTLDQAEIGSQTVSGDSSDLDFTVVYAKNAPTITTESKTINETIHYVYKDGTTAHDDYVAKPVEFTREVSTDAVTGEKTYGSWSADQSFAAVTSSAIKGYTPDQAEIGSQTVSGDSSDLDFTVVYAKNAPTITTESKTINETIHYVYKDGTTAHDDYVAKPVEFTREVSTDAVTGEKTYGSWSADQSFAAVTSPAIKGYTLDQAEIGSQTVSGDSSDLDFTVVYAKNAPTITTESKTINETIHYVYKDGTTAHDDYVAKPVEFTREVSTDAVTGEKTYGSWSADQSFAAVTSPAIKGYTPDQAEIGSQTVSGDSSDLDFTVVYAKNAPTITTESKTINETIHYVYKDGTTAHDDYVAKPVEFTREVSTDAVTGEKTYGSWSADQSFAAVTSPAIKGYTPDQAEIGSQTVSGDSSDLDFTVVYAKNAPTITTESKTINETIHYVYKDGTTAHDDYVAKPVEFTREVSTDAVTGEKTYGSWSADQSFAAVTSPELKGYTADKAQIDKQTVNGDSKDLEFKVTYTKTPVAGGNVTAKYVDENGNPIADDVIASGNVGDPYSTTQKDVPGYTFKEVQGNPTGSFTDQDQTVTYVYTKNPATDNNGGTGLNQPGKPGNGTDTGNSGSNQPGNPSQPSNATNNGVINTSTNTGSKVNNGAVNSPELPQTGENNSQSQTMSFIGILLAMFGSLLGFLGIKKRRND